MRKLLPVVMGLMAGEVAAQEMGYSSSGHQARPDYVQSVDADRLNTDWLNLPSDVTLGKWAQVEFQQHFQSLDANGDTVLSEGDLLRPAPDLAQRWAEQSVIDIFTLWLPNLEEHLAVFDARSAALAAEHQMLAPAAQGGKQIREVMKGLGVLGRTWSDTYLEARIAGESSVGSAGEVAQGSRSWVSVDVPMDLVFHQGGGSEPQVYSYTATLLGIYRFSRHEDEPRFALWDIGISGR
jgi:hypothetical protein